MNQETKAETAPNEEDVVTRPRPALELLSRLRRGQTVLNRRKRIKQKTIEQRRRLYYRQKAA